MEHDTVHWCRSRKPITYLLADRTTRSMIGSCHHNVVCPSVDPSVCNAVVHTVCVKGYMLYRLVRVLVGNFQLTSSGTFA